MKKPKTHKIKEAPTTKMYRNPQKSKNKKLPYRQFKQSIHSNIMMASNPLTKQEKKKLIRKSHTVLLQKTHQIILKLMK